MLFRIQEKYLIISSGAAKDFGPASPPPNLPSFPFRLGRRPRRCPQPCASPRPRAPPPRATSGSSSAGGVRVRAMTCAAREPMAADAIDAAAAGFAVKTRRGVFGVETTFRPGVHHRFDRKRRGFGNHRVHRPDRSSRNRFTGGFHGFQGVEAPSRKAGGTGQSAHARAPLSTPARECLHSHRPSFSLDAMSAGDPLGDAPTRRMEAVVLARSGLPGERPGGPMARSRGEGTKTTLPTAVAPNRRSELGDTRRPPRRASPSRRRRHGSPPRLGGRRGERDHGARVRWTAPSPPARRTARPRDRGGARPRRAAAQEARRTSSGRRSTRGSCGSPRGGRSTTPRCSTRPSSTRRRTARRRTGGTTRKTDTATTSRRWRERLVAKVAAREAAMPKRRRAPCPPRRGNPRSTDGPAPARPGRKRQPRRARRERYRGAVKRPIAHRGGRGRQRSRAVCNVHIALPRRDTLSARRRSEYV